MVSFSTQLLSALALTGLLTFASSFPGALGATAQPKSQPKLAIAVANLPKNLPTAVTAAVLKDIMKSSGLPRTALKVVKATAHTWSDGCLELADPETMCTQAMVSGWQVTVKAQRQRWVYRTNDNGTVIKFDRSASRLQAQALPWVDLGDLVSPTLPPDAIFRVITSGGFTGQTRQTLLLADGRMIQSRVNGDGTTSEAQTQVVSPQQLQHFQQTLAAAHLKQFDRRSYPATPGAADFFTWTLTSRVGTVQYAETMQAQLPDRLQAVVQAWEQLAPN